MNLVTHLGGYRRNPGWYSSGISKSQDRFNSHNELTFIGLGAVDLFELNRNIKNPDDQQKYILSQIPKNEQWSYTVGAVYKHFKDNSYQTIAVSRSHLNNVITKYLENDESSEQNKILDYTSRELENKIRLENVTRIDGFKASMGINVDFAEYQNSTMQKRFYNGEVLNVDYITRLPLVKYGFYSQFSHVFPSARLTLSGGFRMDANNYSSTMNNPLKQFSPRISCSFQLTEKWSLNFNTGRYYQLPAYTTLGYKQDNVFVNKDNALKYISADHFIVVLEYKPALAMHLDIPVMLTPSPVILTPIKDDGLREL